MQVVKILYITGTMELGGTESLVRNWCETLDANGFLCKILCIIEKKGPHAVALKQKGIEVIELCQSKHGKFGFARQLRKIIGDLSIDIVHSQCAWSIPQQVYGSKLGGAKALIFTLHNTYRSGNIWQKLRRRIAVIFCRPFIDIFTGVSETVSRHGESWLGLAKDSILTIKNGIEVDRFEINSMNKARFRRELALPDEGRLAVTVASLTYQKDHETLLKAVSLLRSRIKDLKFVFVGDGPLRNTLQKSVNHAGIENSVIFLGKRVDVPKILHACDLFILPSRWEGLPLCLVEAHAASLPIVATRVGGNSEVVQDGRTGLLVPSGDANLLANAIEELIMNKDLLKVMGNRGSTFVREHFDIHISVDRYRSLYLSLLNEDARS